MANKFFEREMQGTESTSKKSDTEDQTRPPVVHIKIALSLSKKREAERVFNKLASNIANEETEIERQNGSYKWSPFAFA